MVKLAVVFLLFGAMPPTMAYLMRGRVTLQRSLFALVCFMTIGGLMGPAEWGLTLGSVEWYRGHAKGYHFYFSEALALALTLAIALERKPSFRWFPPGAWLYLAYVFLCLLSIVNAPVKGYTLMAALKCFKMGVFLVMAFNFVRTDDDLHWFLTVMVFVMGWELMVVLKLKYLQGMYQVRGTFEHQNPLSMFSSMIGLILLATGMGPPHPRANWYLFGYLCTAAIVQSTLSRAGLVVFAFGTAMVVGLSILDKPTKRRILAVASLGTVGTLGLLLTIGTIVARFHDQGNEASKETRDLLNDASRHMLRDFHLGIGWNNFAHTINHPFAYGDGIDDWERERGHKVDEDYAKGVVESHYYLLLAETGYQGFLAYIAFIMAFLYWNARGFLAFRHHLRGCVSLGIAVGCSVNYLQSSLERVLTQPRNLMLWLLLLGIAARIEIWRREVQNVAPASP